ncbi:hypothetical protein EVAR_24238_1 [Eumeta japonica]|uniref:Uncharacterized protein n=1 Tax=Eumeta variegata TaxID=151549 RepID=A0A4C1W793_EUMVA|nr:hypothetical protein EVAR_24238_1 [Eumeta japonica]
MVARNIYQIAPPETSHAAPPSSWSHRQYRSALGNLSYSAIVGSIRNGAWPRHSHRLTVRPIQRRRCASGRDAGDVCRRRPALGSKHFSLVNISAARFHFNELKSRVANFEITFLSATAPARPQPPRRRPPPFGSNFCAPNPI